MSDAPEINEALPVPSPTRVARFVGAISTLIGGGTWLMLLVLFTRIVPRFEEIVKKFDIKSDLLMATVFRISHLVGRLGLLLFPAVVIVTTVLIVLCFASPRKTVVTACVIAGAVSVVVCLLISLCLFEPLLVLIRSVSGAHEGGPGPD
jgi:hypothetical protein